MSWLDQESPRFDQAFDALERGDLDGFTATTRQLIDSECEFRSGIGSVVGGGAYKGMEGIREWFGDLIQSTSTRQWRNRSYEVHGEGILVFVADFEFTGVASGATVENETGAVLEFEDRLCIRVNSFMSHAEAREFAEARVA
jgi:ketosteroid isomerase-like protein